MKILGTILIFVLLFCRNYQVNAQVYNSNVEMESEMPERQNDSVMLEPLTKFYIKDESQYSISFLREFKRLHSCYEVVSLINDTIVINNDKKNFIIIPTGLPLNKQVIYQTSKNEKEYRLIVIRLNISTIEYEYSEIVNGKKINQLNGCADIEPVFYFGAEGTFEDGNGNIFAMNEYIDLTRNNCSTYIYIGSSSIEKSFLINNCETNNGTLKTPELIRNR